MTSTKKPTLTDLQKQIAALTARLEALAPTTTEPTPRVRAQGTTPPLTVPDVGEAAPLALRIENTLRRGPRTFSEIAADLDDVPEGRLHKAFQSMRRSGKVWNIGDDTQPRWVWRIGDDVDTRVLRAYVELLCRIRPMTWAELVDATGASPNRVKGVCTDLRRRTDDPVRDFGTSTRAVYYFPPTKR